MTEPTAGLAHVISTLKGFDEQAAADLASRYADADQAGGTRTRSHHARDRLVAHVQQAPLREDVRRGLLDTARALPALSPATWAALTADLVAHPTRTPVHDIAPISLGEMPPGLDGAFRALIALDQAVQHPWSLVGGLMVRLHALEAGVPVTRTTSDADVAVNVFTAADSLRDVTSHLIDLGFDDTTNLDPRTGGPSYRYERETVRVDVLIPEKADAARRPARTITGRVGVGMWGMQSAIKRTQRVPVQMPDGTTGWVRRPDLLGAIAAKSAAAIRDTSPARHHEDLVHLCDWAGASLAWPQFQAEITRKQRRRLRKIGADRLPWYIADDPDGARDVYATLARSVTS